MTDVQVRYASGEQTVVHIKTQIHNKAYLVSDLLKKKKLTN